MDPTRDELQSELHRVEQSIEMLTESDGFIEDLISRHAERKTLIAALANRSRNRRQRIVTLDLWRKAARRNHTGGRPAQDTRLRPCPSLMLLRDYI
jgi:hypothetical protein